MKKIMILSFGVLFLLSGLISGALAQSYPLRSESLETQNRINRFIQTRQEQMERQAWETNPRRENLFPSNRYVIRRGQYVYKKNNIGFWKRSQSQRPHVRNFSTRIWRDQPTQNYVIQYPKNEITLRNIGYYRPVYEMNQRYYFLAN